MKIGILTYHKAHNYGALLQAYALKTFIEKKGFVDVSFIDYFPEYHQRMYENIKPNNFWKLGKKGKIKYPLYYFRDFYPLYFLKEKRRKSFNQFIKNYLLNSKNSNSSNSYDIVIYGSDQIWRKQSRMDPPGFNQTYFGYNDIKARKNIAFSASMGIIDLNEDDKLFLTKSFENFSAISVREKQLYDEIISFSDYPIQQTLDPVFLLSKSDWNEIIKKKIYKGKYLLFYNLHADKTSYEIANHIASRLEIPIIELTGDIHSKKNPGNCMITYGPLEFLSLIKYAEFVVSSSFHGIALSVIFEKQFYIHLETNYQRVDSLLEIIGLTERRVKDIEDILKSARIDYKSVNTLLEIEIKKSSEFLYRSILK